MLLLKTNIKEERATWKIIVTYFVTFDVNFFKIMVPCKYFLNFDTEIKKRSYKQTKKKNQDKTKNSTIKRTMF